MRDMDDRGRRVITSILTKENVQEIRIRLSKGEKHKNIAKDYGVHRATVSQIARGQNWKDKTVVR